MGEHVPQGNPTLNVLKDPRSRRLEEIYARIPKIECQRKCQAACGLVCATGRIEDERLLRQTGEKFGETFFATRPFLGVPWVEANHVHCDFLTLSGDCEFYPLRPLMCRLFGVIRELECPHGCKPERWLTDAEKMELILAVEAL